MRGESNLSQTLTLRFFFVYIFKILSIILASYSTNQQSYPLGKDIVYFPNLFIYCNFQLFIGTIQKSNTFCIFNLYPVFLQSSLTSSSRVSMCVCVCVDRSLGIFYIDNYIFFKQGQFYFFFSNLYTYFLFYIFYLVLLHCLGPPVLC